MPQVQLTKSAIDLGIVVRSIEPMLAFYRDTLGLTLDATLPMPGGTTMYRLACGDTVLKLLIHKTVPSEGAAGGRCVPSPPPGCRHRYPLLHLVGK